MGTTFITYGGNARCGDNLSRTQSVRYVAVRGNGYYNSGPRYISVRNADSYYPTRRVRYVAARSVDYDDAPRYVAVRRQPAYVESRTRYIAVGNGDLDDASRYVAVGRYSNNAALVTRYAAVRSGYRTGNGIVGYVDVNDAPRYVAVRRQPVYESGTRYVAVRNVDSDYDVRPARYVAVRNISNACACAGELRSSLDDVEAVSPRHVVAKSDYLAGTQEVIVPDTSYDDTADVALPSESVNRTSVGYTNAAYLDDNGETIIPASNVESPCMRQVALRTCAGDAGTRTISYVPTYVDNDYDHQAVLDTGGATYVAADDIGDACLNPVAVQASPMEISTRAVNYVPVNDVDNYASLRGSDTTYIVNDNTAPAIRYVPVVDDDDNVADTDMTLIAADNTNDSCTCPVALRTFNDVDAESVRYIPVNDVEDTDADTVNIVSVKKVSYVPTTDTDLRTVSYVPANSVDDVDTADTAACECPAAVNSVVTQPVDVADPSTAIVEGVDSAQVADLSAVQQVAGESGYADGLADGRNAALNRDENRPGDTDNFQTATNGYDDTVGDMDIYKDAYRSSYLQGFSAGYDAVTGSG